MSKQTITLDQFRVDLAQLKQAQTLVEAFTADIQLNVIALDECISNVGQCWGAPAGATLPPVQQFFNTQMATLVGLLVEMAKRMGTAYDNYRTVEESGAKTFTLG
jgi:uncharacterized protein YukE